MSDSAAEIDWFVPGLLAGTPARASNEGSRRVFSWLKVPTSAFTFKTLLRHYAKRALTPRSLNVKLGPRHKSQKRRKVWLSALVGAFSVIVQLHRLIDLRHCSILTTTDTIWTLNGCAGNEDMVLCRQPPTVPSRRQFSAQ